MEVKIRSLKVQSFRGFKDVTLDLSSPVTVFLGINGAGKSTILDCLAILLSRFTALLQVNYPGNNSPKLSHYKTHTLPNQLQNWFRIPTSPVIVFNDPDIRNGEQEAYAEISISVDNTNVDWSVKKRLNFPNDVQDENFEALKDVVTNLQARLENAPASSLPLIAYYSTNRVVSQITLEASSTANSSIQTSAYGETLEKTQVGFASFFSWFRVMEDLENEQRRDNPHYRNPQLEAVRSAIPQFLTGFSDLRVRRSPPLRMTVAKDGQELIISQLSDGEKCLLAVIGDLARKLSIANPSLLDPLEGEGIVLIDELELHLHPQWQRGIIPKLTSIFPNCQFIVSTHSPQIVGDVRPENIYILQSSPDGIAVSHPTSSYGRDSNWILEDVMGADARNEVKQQLFDLFKLIDAGSLDQAKELKANLEQLIGIDEPEFAKADVLIRRKEILGK
jgi:predicted ATP-binding protein involved in virulence